MCQMTIIKYTLKESSIFDTCATYGDSQRIPLNSRCKPRGVTLKCRREAEEARKERREKFQRGMNGETRGNGGHEEEKDDRRLLRALPRPSRVASRNVTTSTWPTYTKDLARKSLASDDHNATERRPMMNKQKNEIDTEVQERGERQEKGYTEK